MLTSDNRASRLIGPKGAYPDVTQLSGIYCIPIGHSVQMKEDYKNVKFLLESISYARYNWQLCGDFKMIGFLKGLQGGYTKHSCFLCLWDSRAVTEHYSRKDWPEGRFFIPGTQNVKHDPLVDSEKILMPPPP